MNQTTAPDPLAAFPSQNQHGGLSAFLEDVAALDALWPAPDRFGLDNREVWQYRPATRLTLITRR